MNYVFEKSETTLELPQEIINIKPSSSEDHIVNEVVTANREFESTWVDAVNDGVWEFAGFDKENVQITDKNEVFVGTWKFKPNVHTLTYQFTTDSKFELPTAIQEMLPVATTHVKNDVVEVNKDFATTFNDTINDGIWEFVAFDKENVTFDNEDITVIGTWKFKPNVHTLTYQFTTDSKFELPTAIQEMLPVATTHVKNDVVKINKDFSLIYHDKENNGVWTFEGFEKDEVIFENYDISVKGVWKFSKNNVKPPVTTNNSSIFFVVFLMISGYIILRLRNM